jgi:hypothetical protein
MGAPDGEDTRRPTPTNRPTTTTTTAPTMAIVRPRPLDDVFFDGWAD